MILKIIVYAIFSSMGLLFLKIGAGQDFDIFFSKYSFSLRINYMVILGLVFYMASFLLSLSIMKQENLSIFYSLANGMAYICIGLLSCFVLKESISMLQMMGMGLILAGIIMMNFKR